MMLFSLSFERSRAASRIWWRILFSQASRATISTATCRVWDSLLSLSIYAQQPACAHALFSGALHGPEGRAKLHSCANAHILTRAASARKNQPSLQFPLGNVEDRLLPTLEETATMQWLHISLRWFKRQKKTLNSKRRLFTSLSDAPAHHWKK